MFSINHQFLYRTPEGPLKIPCRSRMLEALGDIQGISPGLRVPAGLFASLLE